MDITVKISDEEYKAMSHIVPSVEEWVQNALTAKARVCVHKVVEANSDYRAAKLTDATKLDIVNKLTLKTRVQLDAEAMEEFESQMSLATEK